MFTIVRCSYPGIVGTWLIVNSIPYTGLYRQLDTELGISSIDPNFYDDHFSTRVRYSA